MSNLGLTIFTQLSDILHTCTQTERVVFDGNYIRTFCDRLQMCDCVRVCDDTLTAGSSLVLGAYEPISVTCNSMQCECENGQCSNVVESTSMKLEQEMNAC